MFLVLNINTFALRNEPLCLVIVGIGATVYVTVADQILSDVMTSLICMNTSYECRLRE